MCRLISMRWIVVVALSILSIATFSAPRAALGGMYRFDKIVDTTEFYTNGARAVPSISENGAVTYCLEGITTVDPSYKDLSGFGIPLDDSGPFTFFGEPNFTDQGEAVLFGRHEDNGNTILFWSDGNVSTVVDQSGIYHSVSGRSSINNRGDVLFGATLDTMSDVGSTQYIWNEGIIESVVGAGDMIDGKTIGTVSGGRDSLNDAGQVAFNVVFFDGSRAIYRATPIPVPEPASSVILLMAAGLFGLSFRRRRRRSSMKLC